MFGHEGNGHEDMAYRRALPSRRLLDTRRQRDYHERMGQSTVDTQQESREDLGTGLPDTKG